MSVSKCGCHYLRICLALETLLQFQRAALLQRFAIDGAVAASFYVEPRKMPRAKISA